MRNSRFTSTLGLIVMMACAAIASSAERKPNPGQLTGTWECMSHGGTQNDLAFTLYLEQSKEVVTGSVSSPIGAAEITSGSFKRKFLELQIDTQRGNYVIMGKLEKGQLSGTWSLDNGDKGTWEGKKVTPSK
jgi:hypothetical protein